MIGNTAVWGAARGCFHSNKRCTYVRDGKTPCAERSSSDRALSTRVDASVLFVQTVIRGLSASGHSLQQNNWSNSKRNRLSEETQPATRKKKKNSITKCTPPPFTSQGSTEEAVGMNINQIFRTGSKEKRTTGRSATGPQGSAPTDSSSY